MPKITLHFASELDYKKHNAWMYPHEHAWIEEMWPAGRPLHRGDFVVFKTTAKKLLMFGVVQATRPRVKMIFRGLVRGIPRPKRSKPVSIDVNLIECRWASFALRGVVS